MVLELLLKPAFENGMITTFTDHLKKVEPDLEDINQSTEQKEYEASLSNSAQLLRCCQSLYQEGVVLLYRQQKIVVDFEVPDYTLSCSMLAERFEFPPQCETEELGPVYWHDMLQSEHHLTLTELPKLFPSKWHVILRQFEQVQFNICEQTHATEVFMLCRGLRDALRNAKVVVSVDVVKLMDRNRARPTALPHVFLSSFQHLNTTVVDSLGRSLPVEVSQILQQRKREGCDVYMLWEKFAANILHRLPRYHDFEGEGVIDELDDLLVAALDNDMRQYRTAMAKLLVCIKSWVQKQLEFRTATLQALLEQTKEDFSTINVTVSRLERNDDSEISLHDLDGTGQDFDRIDSMMERYLWWREAS